MRRIDVKLFKNMTLEEKLKVQIEEVGENLRQDLPDSEMTWFKGRRDVLQDFPKSLWKVGALLYWPHSRLNPGQVGSLKP